MFRYPYVIRFHDTDPAGIVFFANILRFAHEAYEAWMEDRGSALGTWVADGRAGLPIAHASAHFHAPMKLGDRIEIRVSVTRAGRTSYTLGYEIVAADSGDRRATAETVHVHVDKDTGRPSPLPEELRRLLEE